MQQKSTSLKLNFIMNIILTLSTFIFPLITFPYISRVLGPESIGKVTFATSFIMYFNYVAQLGIPTYGVRACAKVRDDKEKLSTLVQELLIINIIATFVTYVLFAILLATVPKLYTEKTLYLIISSSIFLNTIGMEWLYRALEQYAYITKRSLIFKIIAVIMMFMLVHEPDDYVVYGAISIFAASASNLYNFFNSRKYISLRKTERYEIRKHLNPICVFFAMTCAATIYTNLDTVMLGFMTSDSDVGYYNAAVKIKTILVAVVTSLSTVLLPRASYYMEKGLINEFKKISSKAIQFVVFLATPLVLYFILFAKEGIFFLSGEAYSEAIIPMQVIMPTILFIGLTNIMGIQILVPMGKENLVLYSTIAGAIVDAVLNFLLIPSMKSTGAAIGTLVAEIVVFVVQFISLKKDLKDIFNKIHYDKISIALILATSVAIWVKELEINYFGILFISAVIFFGVYGVVLLIIKEPFVCGLYNDVIVSIKNKIFKKNLNQEK